MSAPVTAKNKVIGVINVQHCEAHRHSDSEIKLLTIIGQQVGKAERTSFEVPTLPLFTHERLSTKAILETLKGHTRDRQMQMLFADPDLSITDRILKAYQHKDRWVNRMILGDSLVAMNSLLHYEGLGGQVQMIYMDPPYGVKFGSNFQPFVRKRDVKHNDDQHMTREPEMVQAYRDTWELGIHSYLTYLRDRLLLCRELPPPSGTPRSGSASAEADVRGGDDLTLRREGILSFSCLCHSRFRSLSSLDVRLYRL